MNFLETFFAGLKDSKVKYIVLRNYSELPTSTGGSDLDIFIQKDQKVYFFKILKEALIEHNGMIVSVINSLTCPRYCLMSVGKESWGLMIDLHFDVITYCDNVIITNRNIWKNVTYHNNICVLNRRTDSLIRLLKELLNNRTCSEKYYDDFVNNSLDEKFLKEIFLEIDKERVIDILMRCKTRKHSKFKINSLAKELEKHFKRKWHAPLLRFRKIGRIARQPGYTFAIIGTDGSGKSALIEAVRPVLKETFHNAVYYEHLRPNYFRGIAQLFGKNVQQVGPVTNPHESTVSGFLGSLFRWIYYLGDYTFGYYFKIFPKKAFKSCVWIFDRYYYDYYIDQRRSRIKLPKWIIRIGQFIIPEPDIIICLGADPAIIHSRKPELSLEEVERQVNELKKFAENHKRAVWVDTGTTIEESRDAAMNYIFKVMAKRFEKVKLT